MSTSTDLTHAEKMSVLGHYLADTWVALDHGGKSLVFQAWVRLHSQLQDLARASREGHEATPQEQQRELVALVQDVAAYPQREDAELARRLATVLSQGQSLEIVARAILVGAERAALEREEARSVL